MSYTSLLKNKKRADDPVAKNMQTGFGSMKGNSINESTASILQGGKLPEDIKDSVKMSQEAFDIVNEGLTATLGKDHGFTYDAEKGVIKYTAPEGKTYTAPQQDIIDRYLALIRSGKAIEVSVVDHDEKIEALGNKSLADMQLNGVTVTTGDDTGILIVKVFLARNPKKWGTVENPKYHPLRDDGQPEEIPGYVDAPAYERGVDSIHELGGHAYLRISQPDLKTAEHNTAVEDFETNFRKFYQVGTYTEKEAKKLNKKGGTVKAGDPKYLGGKADAH